MITFSLEQDTKAEQYTCDSSLLLPQEGERLMERKEEGGNDT